MNKKILTICLNVLAICAVVWVAGCKKKADAAAPAAAKACAADCSKPCCAKEGVKACAPGCTKPCCAKEDAEVKACPAGCTKPCCANKEDVAKTCPLDAAKPCCAVKAAVAATEAAVAQTTCPIMGKPINKDISVEYKGQKVYFCCPGCIDAFNKDPEKYVKDLPQFKE